MEAEKRKRRDDGEAGRKKRKDEEEDGAGTAVTEDEVEEFFAILRRIYVAGNYLRKREAAARGLTAEGRRRLEVLEADGFGGGVDGVDKGEGNSCEDSAESHAGLDLNLEPPSKESTL